MIVSEGVEVFEDVWLR